MITGYFNYQTTCQHYEARASAQWHEPFFPGTDALA